MYVADEPHVALKRAARYIGWQMSQLVKPANGENECRAAIVRSLSEFRRPVIAFGVIGPPEPCLVCGDDEAGDVLIGWSRFQGPPEFGAPAETEPNGNLRLCHWFANTVRPQVFEQQAAKPSLREIDIDGLLFGGRCCRRPPSGATRPAASPSSTCGPNCWTMGLPATGDPAQTWRLLDVHDHCARTECARRRS